MDNDLSKAAGTSPAALILFRDGDLCAAVKPAGATSENDGERSMPALIARALSMDAGDVRPVHRLDRETGGVMVYALSAFGASALSKSVREGRLEKRYLAAVTGSVGEEEGQWRDLLYHDAQRNRSYVVKRMRRGVREAALQFKTARAFGAGDGRPAGEILDIRLLTGRTHQIRAQCASRGHPLIGDRRYGSSAAHPMALWCLEISFPHPRTGLKMTFSCPPPEGTLLAMMWDKTGIKPDGSFSGPGSGGVP